MNRLLLIGMSVLCASLLAACSSGSGGQSGSGTPNIPETPVVVAGPVQPTFISGTVENWSPTGAASVQAEAPTTSGQPQVLSSAVFNSGGTFKLSLPSAEQVKSHLAQPGSLVPPQFPNGCSATFSSGSALLLYSLPNLHAYEGAVDRGLAYPWSTSGSPAVTPTLTVTTVTSIGKLYVYSSDGAPLSGKVKCSGGAASTPTEYAGTIDAALVRGWNVLNSELKTVSSYPQGATTAASSAVTYTLSLGNDGPSKWNLSSPISASGL